MFRKKSLTPEKISVYKYRFGDNNTFERDLKDIEANRFYAPCYEKLNDPFETLVFTDDFDQQVRLFSRIIGRPIDSVKNVLNELVERKNKVGIYSLSKTYNNELLWAHYANSHFGFCIEYNLEALLEKDKNDSDIYPFSIIYSKKPPQITLKDTSGINPIEMIKKIAGTKSINWSYEQEYRIILDQSGHRTYNYEAIKSIYFGVRMNQEKIYKVMNKLKGRGIKYFQMKLDSNNYSLIAHSIEDRYASDNIYFRQIPSDITKSKPIKFKIVERDFYWVKRKATITIELESKTDKRSLEWLGNQIRKYLFSHADRIFMFYNIKGVDNHGVCWASSHFQNGEMKIEFNDFSWLD